MERISIFNYEAFYLDFLEGNLSEEDTVLLFEFLDKHPELKLEDDALVTLNDDLPVLDDQFKMGLKQVEFNETVITAHNAEQFMIAETEGLLSSEKVIELDQFVGSDTDRMRLRKSFAATRLQPDVRVVFADKDSLKRKKKIALWPIISLAAAACAAVLFLLWDPADTALTIQSDQTVAQKDPLDYRNNTDSSEENEGTTQPSADQNMQLETIGTQGITKSVTATTHVTADRPPRVDRLSLKRVEVLSVKSNDREIVPTTWLKPQPVEQTPAKNEYAMVGFDDMKNPIKPITNRLSDVVKQEVDFRTAKPTEKRSGGFYLKIGKFELSHKKH
jgi:hypothetical protein